MRVVCTFDFRLAIYTIPTWSDSQRLIESATYQAWASRTFRLICKSILSFIVDLRLDHPMWFFLLVTFIKFLLSDFLLQPTDFFTKLIILANQNGYSFQQFLRLLKSWHGHFVLHFVCILFYCLQLATSGRNAMRIGAWIIDYVWRLF